MMKHINYQELISCQNHLIYFASDSGSISQDTRIT